MEPITGVYKEGLIMDRTIELTSVVPNHSSWLKLPLQVLRASLAGFLLLLIAWGSFLIYRETKAYIALKKDNLIRYLIEEDLYQRTIEADSKGNRIVVSTLPKEGLEKALLICTYQQDDLKHRLQVINDYALN